MNLDIFLAFRTLFHSSIMHSFCTKGYYIVRIAYLKILPVSILENSSLKEFKFSLLRIYHSFYDFFTYLEFRPIYYLHIFSR